MIPVHADSLIPSTPDSLQCGYGVLLVGPTFVHINDSNKYCRADKGKRQSKNDNTFSRQKQSKRKSKAEECGVFA